MSHQRRAFAGVLPALLAAAFAGACGSPPRPDPDEAFRRIQVQEATIENSDAEARACASEAVCPAADRLCEAAEALCGIAAELDDRDADARCERARARCPRSEP